MTKETSKEKFKTIVVPAIITATSNKTSDSFKQDTYTKTVYFTTGEDEAKKLVDFGLTEYTSKEDNKSYFIVKAVQNVKVYTDVKSNSYVMKSFRVEEINHETGETFTNPNLYTDKLVYLCITWVKGEKGKNDFFRMSAILANDIDDLIEVEQSNPFTELFGE